MSMASKTSETECPYLPITENPQLLNIQ